MMDANVFYIASTVTVLAVIFMIFQKNPVSSAIFLVLSFFGLAVIYLTLDAHFVAALQILVYAGAIMVLFMFVIMLLNLKDEELVYDKIDLKTVIGILLGGCIFAIFTLYYLDLPVLEAPELVKGFGTAKEVGKVLMTKYVLPFELIGILLLVGLVGAILLGRREED